MRTITAALGRAIFQSALYKHMPFQNGPCNKGRLLVGKNNQLVKGDKHQITLHKELGGEWYDRQGFALYNAT